ncbi:hypothetical protein FANTH_9135 [Fusarium anthophilum]|uniref:Uncharacterized protein n=1 Tax=Fusarium anthophilum TaxID=48485 RepID=A0A8H4Z758_9HYPO|nr:hypothetical protein FANTH_9135 [Fusarium anthophilum]
MNPCAPTFIPVDPSEDEFSSDEDESSTPSSMEARHPEQDVRSPRARPRGRTIPSIAINPEGYDSMFPALGSVNQVDPLKIRSPKMKQKQPSRCRRPRGKDDRGLSSELVNDEQLSIEHQFSQCSDDEEETSKQPPLEYLKPTVYTPRKTLEFLKPDVYTPPASSYNSTSRPKTRGSMRPAISRTRPEIYVISRISSSSGFPKSHLQPLSIRTSPSNDASSDQLCVTYGAISGAAYDDIFASSMASCPNPVVGPFGPTRGDDGLSVPAGKDRQLLSAVCSDDSTQEDVKKELRKAADYSKIKGFIPTRQAQNSHDSPRVVRGAKINLKRETTPQEENKAQETHRLADPLQNAPRGPYSARQLPQTFSSTLKQTFNLNGPESGSWSQSKRWTSFATKERQAFQKMMANLRYMSADQSPFVPQSPVELTAFKANLAESKTRKLDQEVKQRLARTNASVDEGAETQVQTVVEFLRGKKFDDGLSPVFAASNCFSTSQNQPPYGAGWPTLAELKEEGDKRSSRQGRCLPLPKLDLVSHTLWSETSGACSSDGAVRNDKRTVQVGSHYLCPVTPEEPSIAPPIELQPEDLPFILAELLQSIDAAEDDTKWTEETNEKMIGQGHEEKAKEKGKGARD